MAWTNFLLVLFLMIVILRQEREKSVHQKSVEVVLIKFAVKRINYQFFAPE